MEVNPNLLTYTHRGEPRASHQCQGRCHHHPLVGDFVTSSEAAVTLFSSKTKTKARDGDVEANVRETTRLKPEAALGLWKATLMSYEELEEVRKALFWMRAGDDEFCLNWLVECE